MMEKPVWSCKVFVAFILCFWLFFGSMSDVDAVDFYEQPLEASSGVVSNTGGNISADQFVLPRFSMITSVRWFGFFSNAGVDPTVTPVEFTIRFLPDDAGLPALTPSSEQTVSVQAQDSGFRTTSFSGGERVIYDFVANLGWAFPVSAGQPTWISIAIAGPAPAPRWLWSFSPASASDSRATRNTGTTPPGDWQSREKFGQLAFTLIEPPGLFPMHLSQNSTGFHQLIFLGRPDNIAAGLGGRTVTYDFGVARILNEDGPDFNVYELGAIEFNDIDVLVSEDGSAFVPVDPAASVVRIFGDEGQRNDRLVRSYDLSTAGLPPGAAVRFVRIAGNTPNPSGGFSDFDLDAIGAIHFSAPRCQGLRATIVGTDKSDMLIGTGGDDVIVGLDGNDFIDGRGGNDTICGGPGNDRLSGGSGDDSISGGGGDDGIDGGPGNDVCNGGASTDTLVICETVTSVP